MAEKQISSNVLKYFLLLFAVTIVLVGHLFWSFLSILILSLILVNISRPVYRFINQYTSDSFASLMTCGLIVVLVFVPLLYFVGALSQEAIAYLQYIKGIKFGSKIMELIHDSPILTAVQTQLSDFGIELKADDIGRNLTEFSRTLALFIYNKASGWAANIINFVVDFSLMILIVFFLLMDYDRLINFLMRLSPMPEYQERQLISKFQKIAQAILVGNGVCGFIQGLLGGILFAYLGIGSPVLWGGIMGIMAFLPIVGIGVILIPTSVIFLLKGSIGVAAFIAIFYLVLSMIIEYLVKPKMVGSQVKMHTLLVFLSIIGGLGVFGVLGIIYGPLIITAFLTMADIYLKDYAQYIQDQVKATPDN